MNKNIEYKTVRVFLMNEKQSDTAAEKIAEDTFSGWLNKLKEKDNPDCENCGS